MGVKGLWSILDPVQEHMPLGDLKHKTVAVDLSAWMVENDTVKSYSNAQNMHIRNLFFRAAYMIQHHIKPIFVLDGNIPDIKADTVKKRIHAKWGAVSSSDCCKSSRSYVQRTADECCILLDFLGLPYIKSQGEAEHLCAILDQEKIVDGVITEDSDTFLYGAKTVYRNFTIAKDAHAECYQMQRIQNDLALSREKLIALALMLGCDYAAEGIPGIGTAKAMELLDFFDEEEISPLERFRQWSDETNYFDNLPMVKSIGKVKHCKICLHPGQAKLHAKSGCGLCDSSTSCMANNETTYQCPCEWHKQKTLAEKYKTELSVREKAMKLDKFPNEEIIKEFTRSHSVPDNYWKWKRPQLNKLQVFLHSTLGPSWQPLYVLQKVIPLLTAWDLQDIACHRICDDHMEPLRIVKTRISQGVPCLEIQWKKIDCDHITEEQFYTTIENEEEFSHAFPDITKQFFDDLEAKKKAKKGKSSKTKKAKDVSQRKMTDFFTIRKNATFSPKMSVTQASTSSSNSPALLEKSKLA